MRDLSTAGRVTVIVAILLTLLIVTTGPILSHPAAVPSPATALTGSPTAGSSPVTSSLAARNPLGSSAGTTESTSVSSSPSSSPAGSDGTSAISGPASAVLDPTRPLSSGQKVPSDAIYPPSRQLTASRPASPTQAISPGYLVSPAPMGLADYGVGAEGATYSVFASDVLGTVQLNSYNASAGPLYEDTGAYYWDYANPYADATPWQSSIELNTVVANISYPGANNGSFWTQNVVSFEGPSLQLIDNVWNLSNPYESLNPDTLYSYGGVAAYPEFYYADGPTFPVAYPMTIQLYNNATVIHGRSVITFGYRIAEPRHVYTGVYDEVVFNSTPNATVPLLRPAYLVSGTNLTPAGLLYDAELVFGGPGSGTNAVINSLNGSEALSYRVGSHWIPPRAAYDYGADTGETSVGIAGWYRGTTEYINQGPSMLYGLWKAQGGVPSGDIAVRLALDPDYQFVFIGTAGTDVDNESYAPSTAAGVVQTWLPPGDYELSGWADGFDTGYREFHTSLHGSLTLSSAPGVWDAPVYIDGRAQAEAIGTDAAGWSGSGPIRFVNLSIDVSLIFNHVNDFGYTEFSLLWAYDFSSPRLYVSNVTQGPNLGGATLYVGDAPGEVTDIPELGDSIEAWDVSGPRFANLTLSGVDLLGAEEGGVVAVWDAPGAGAFQVNSTNDSFGFWAANSRSVSDMDSSSTLDGFAFSLMASPDAVGTDLSSNYFGYTVLAYGSDDGVFSGLQALQYSVGFTAYSSNGTRLSGVVAEVDSTGVDLDYTLHDRVQGVFANSSSTGVFGSSTISLSLSSISASTSAGQILTSGIIIYGGNWTNISGLWTNNSEGVEFLGGFNESLRNVNVTDGSLGALFIETGTANIENFTADNSLGVFVEYNVGPVTARDLVAYNGGIGIAVFLGAGVRISDVYAYGAPGASASTYGADVADSDGTSVTGVTSESGGIGVNVSGSTSTTVRQVDALSGADGVQIYDSVASVVSQAVAVDGSVAVSLYEATNTLVRSVTADDHSTGVQTVDSDQVTIRSVVAYDYSYGVYLADSTDVTIHDVQAYDHSIAVFIA